METGDRKCGAAKCRIRKTAAVPAEMRDGIRELASLHVPADEQRKGYATSLVHKVCREADDGNMVLMIWPMPYGDDQAMSKEQLIEWYGSRFGFQQIQPEPVLMARMPGSTPRLLKLNPVIEAIHK